MSADDDDSGGPPPPDGLYIDDDRLIEQWTSRANTVRDGIPVIQYAVGVGWSLEGRRLAFIRVRTPEEPDVESGPVLVMQRELAEALVADLGAMLAIEQGDLPD